MTFVVKKTSPRYPILSTNKHECTRIKIPPPIHSSHNRNIMIYKDESYAITGAAIYVHTQLGHGFLEPVYQEALAITLAKNGIPHEREKEIKIYFDNHPLNKTYIADFICYDKIIVELKAVPEITNTHIAQTINYLKATRHTLGLIYNFGAERLQTKRIVL